MTINLTLDVNPENIDHTFATLKTLICPVSIAATSESSVVPGQISMFDPPQEEPKPKPKRAPKAKPAPEAAPKEEAKVNVPAPEIEEAPEAEEAPKPAAATSLTKTDIRATALELSKAGKQAELAAAFKKFDCKKLSDFDDKPELYEALMKELVAANG